MLISIPVFLSCLLLAGSARAQVSAPSCSDGTFSWAYNSLHQSPCLVGAYLAAACNNGSFSLPSLSTGYSYNGPTNAGDICICNTVFYNLISACDACQGESWTPYSVWAHNCTSNTTSFPQPVPDGTRVPKWAYIDTSISNYWNITVAQRDGDSPEVTGTVTPSASSSSASASHHSSNVGAIAGGIVGGVVGAALFTGIVLWFVLRHRRARSAPPAVIDFPGGEREQPMPPPYAEGAPKLYDPSDPTTYPSKDYLPSDRRLGSHSDILTQPSNGVYSGLPEI